MRQIKFRAWLTQEKRMVDVYKLDFFTKDGKPTVILWYLLDKGTQVGLPKDFELMQYTGLKDKNGKEIYEGDIVRDSHGDLYVIKWIDDIMFFVGDPVVAYRKAYGVDVSDLEVVGNIYETPHLLGGEK